MVNGEWKKMKKQNSSGHLMVLPNGKSVMKPKSNALLVTAIIVLFSLISVKVTGFSAHFCTLDPQFQTEFLHRVNYKAI